MKRRTFLLGSTLPFLNLLSADHIRSKPLFIPPMLKPSYVDNKKVFNLNVKEGSSNFLNSKETKTYGVNLDYLGSTISFRNKDQVELVVKNSLKEKVALHWHGLVIEGKFDGNPHNTIKRGDTFVSKLNTSQKAATLFYHPHTLHETGRQTFMGIGGLIYIEDDEKDDLKLPSEYGVDDIPIVIQDRKFKSNGDFDYRLSAHERMMGPFGNVILTNGVINPHINVSAKMVRLRILNASNARYYVLKMSDNRPIYHIAGDNSLLQRAYKTPKIILAPAERAEVLIDFSRDYKRELSLKDSMSKIDIVRFNVNKRSSNSYKVPTHKLTTLSTDEYRGAKRRTFYLNDAGMMGGFTINKKRMKISVINEKVKLNTPEIWTVVNRSHMAHPMHFHGTGFSVLSRNGKGIYVSENCLKDTVSLQRGEMVDLGMTFTKEADDKFPYMYHCHVLEHEDGGMMGQFSVTI